MDKNELNNIISFRNKEIIIYYKSHRILFNMLNCFIQNDYLILKKYDIWKNEEWSCRRYTGHSLSIPIDWINKVVY